MPPDGILEVELIAPKRCVESTPSFFVLEAEEEAWWLSVLTRGLREVSGCVDEEIAEDDSLPKGRGG